MMSHWPHLCAWSQLLLARRAASSARASQSSLSPVYGKKFFVTQGSRWRRGNVLVERQGSFRRFLWPEDVEGVGECRERTRWRSLKSLLGLGERGDVGDEMSTVMLEMDFVRS